MENSRASVAGAGWECPSNGFEDRVPPRQRNQPFSWLSPGPLWESRNQLLVRPDDDPTIADREAWMRHIHGDADPDLVMRIGDGGGDEVRFIVAGDTGEGDASQWAVVPLLERLAADHAFLFIASDVIYPAGGVLDYGDKFFAPYAGFGRPIFAVPGNHDWYDALTGFMAHLCDRLDVPAGVGRGPRSRLRRTLWRPARRATPERLNAIPHRAARRALGPPQPGPYFAVDTGPLLLVGIDTGITNVLDARQGAWLRRISAGSPKPKILITGKPLIVDGRREPGTIADGGTVDAIVRDPAHGYVAAIGGDIHNYQRYPVTLPDGRVLQYIVSGGGGAFMHATHTIGRIDGIEGVDEAAFRCYPLRGDSLSFFSRAYAQRARRLFLLGRGVRRIEPAQAAAYMAERLGIRPTKPEVRDVVVSDETRRSAQALMDKKGPNVTGFLQPRMSEFLDWNTAPLFKHALSIHATPTTIAIDCVAATGCVGDDRRAPEDRCAAELRDGRWEWRTLTG